MERSFCKPLMRSHCDQSKEAQQKRAGQCGTTITTTWSPACAACKIRGGKYGRVIAVVAQNEGHRKVHCCTAPNQALLTLRTRRQPQPRLHTHARTHDKACSAFSFHSIAYK
eukprot:3215599-Pleurochrysis_carterae.AAC.2